MPIVQPVLQSVQVENEKGKEGDTVGGVGGGVEVDKDCMEVDGGENYGGGSGSKEFQGPGIKTVGVVANVG